MEQKQEMGCPLLEKGAKKQAKNQQNTRFLWSLLAVMVPGLFLLSFVARSYMLEGRLPRDQMSIAAGADVDRSLKMLSEYEIIHWTGWRC